MLSFFVVIEPGKSGRTVPNSSVSTRTVDAFIIPYSPGCSCLCFVSDIYLLCLLPTRSSFIHRQETCHGCHRGWIRSFHAVSLTRSNFDSIHYTHGLLKSGVSGLDYVSILLMAGSACLMALAQKRAAREGLYGFFNKKEAARHNSECYLLCILPYAMRRNLNRSENLLS
ncbi:MAG: hypothetical protein JWQ71_1130 [Pedosphaera sp.]|nr:hypothetical protein [Pedosphaera sp.]